MMLSGFLVLYIELGGMIALSGYIISALFVPMIMPDSVSSEQALLLFSQ